MKEYGVMSSWGYFHGSAGDVEHGEVDELSIHAGQTLKDLFTGQVGDVEVDAAVWRSSAFMNLGVVGEGDPVAR